MKEYKPTRDMIIAAKLLNEGDIIFCYLDGKAIRMETEDGEDPYVWRHNKWVPMRAH